MKRNILFVVDEKRMGGVSVLLEDMMNMINISKYNIDILVLHNNGEMLENLDKKINIIYGTPYFEAVDYSIKEVLKSRNLKLIYRKLKLIFDMKTGHIEKVIKKERKKILKKKYDVEIAFKDGFTALFTTFGDSIKKVHWLQYEYKKINPNANYDKLFRKILPTFDNIVAVSDNVKKYFNDIYNLNDKVEVIYNIIDQDKIKIKSKEDCDVVLNKNDLNIVSVGRLHKMKGYDRLIEAFSMLKKENLLNGIKFRLYGNGLEYENLKQQINNLELNDNIMLMGQVLNPYKYLKNNDLFVLSSVYEPFGLVIVEALSLHVPVLATSNSATSKLIEDDKTGLIVENSVEGIYKGLKKIINNKEIIKEYKSNLKDYSYDNSELVKQIEKILD